MKTLQISVAVIGFCIVAACVGQAPAAELNVDNVKRLMKGGAEVSGGSFAVTGTSTFTGAVTPSSTKNKGVGTTADAGTGSGTAAVTVTSGAKCVCGAPDGTAVTECSVSSTTLTITTAAESVAVNYLCF